jgi:hypothetical protein
MLNKIKIPRRVVRHSTAAIMGGVGAAALLAWALATWGNFEEPRGLFAGMHASTAVFPESDKKLEAITAAELAKQGQQLQDIEPAAGEPGKKKKHP